MATDYIVFQYVEDTDSWARVGPDKIPAASADAAIRSLVEDREISGSFAAIPARSFNPRTVKVQTRATFAKHIEGSTP